MPLILFDFIILFRFHRLVVVGQLPDCLTMIELSFVIMLWWLTRNTQDIVKSIIINLPWPA
jgi:hypothetical protein